MGIVHALECDICEALLKIDIISYIPQDNNIKKITTEKEWQFEEITNYTICEECRED